MWTLRQPGYCSFFFLENNSYCFTPSFIGCSYTIKVRKVLTICLGSFNFFTSQKQVCVDLSFTVFLCFCKNCICVPLMYVYLLIEQGNEMWSQEQCSAWNGFRTNQPGWMLTPRCLQFWLETSITKMSATRYRNKICFSKLCLYKTKWFLC